MTPAPPTWRAEYSRCNGAGFLLLWLVLLRCLAQGCGLVAFQCDVLVAGAGPAGIAAAIAASRKGLRVTVADYRKPPIDKTCGEGLLPEAVAALGALGLPIDSSTAFPFDGIRFSDDTSSASAKFPRGSAFGLRRTVLHSHLIERATELGVCLSVGLADYRAGCSRRLAEWFACSVTLDCRRRRARFRHSQVGWPRYRPSILPLRIPPALFGCSLERYRRGALGRPLPDNRDADR